MSSHQELPSVLASLEQGGSLIHTVNIAPLSLLLGNQQRFLDPSPLALSSLHRLAKIGLVF